MSGYPPISEFLPHAGPMRLLRRVLAHAEDETLCEAAVEDAALFAQDDGSVPAWLALEWMAQCIAAHGGLLARARAEPPRPGLLVGSRRVLLGADAFPAGARLRVRARHAAGDARLLAFDCNVADGEDGAALAEARINVYIPDDLARLSQE